MRAYARHFSPFRRPWKRSAAERFPAQDVVYGQAVGVAVFQFLQLFAENDVVESAVPEKKQKPAVRLCVQHTFQNRHHGRDAASCGKCDV